MSELGNSIYIYGKVFEKPHDWYWIYPDEDGPPIGICDDEGSNFIPLEKCEIVSV